jgi:hypothetical protein
VNNTMMAWKHTASLSVVDMSFVKRVRHYRSLIRGPAAHRLQSREPPPMLPQLANLTAQRDALGPCACRRFRQRSRTAAVIKALGRDGCPSRPKPGHKKGEFDGRSKVMRP